MIDVHDTSSWPEGMLGLLCNEGLLEEASPSSVHTCTDCDDQHTEEVQRVEEPLGSAARLYISCPVRGRIRVGARELRRWRLVPEGWARLVGRLLGAAVNCQLVVPGRAWWVGVAILGGDSRQLFFARGLDWQSGGQSTVEQIAVCSGPALPVVFVPYGLPVNSHINAASLSQIMRLVDDGIHLNQARLDAVTSGWRDGKPLAATGESLVFEYAEDFRSVVLRGVAYSLTPRQAQVIELLFGVRGTGMPELSQEYILDRIGSKSLRLTLRDVFRKSPAWKTLVVPGDRRGMYRLNL
jgi:hypothetical protein